MKNIASIRLLSVLLAAIPVGGFAQTTAPVYPIVQTVNGNFKSTDGNSGTFVETKTTFSATSKTDAIVFTRTKDGATRMATTDTTLDPDGRTVDFSSTDFDQTGTFMSHKVITKEKNGQYAGAGTYTTEMGDSGTLTTLETKAETVNVVSAIYNSPTTGITNELRLEDDGFGFSTDKTITLHPDGKVTTLVHTRYITGK